MTSGASGRPDEEAPRFAVRWSHLAKADLRHIGHYIRQEDTEEAASRWVAKLLDAANEAATFPRAGRIVPEIGREDTRETILGAYRLVYRIRDDTIEVVMVFEGHRRLPEDRKDELGRDS